MLTHLINCQLSANFYSALTISQLYWRQRSPKHERRRKTTGQHWFPLIRFTLASLLHSDIQYWFSKIRNHVWTYPHVKYKGDLQRIGRNLLHPLFGSVEWLNQNRKLIESLVCHSFPIMNAHGKRMITVSSGYCYCGCKCIKRSVIVIRLTAAAIRNYYVCVGRPSNRGKMGFSSLLFSSQHSLAHSRKG